MTLTVARRCEIEHKAIEMGLELTDEHWAMIAFAQDFYERKDAMCNLRTLIREGGYDKKTAYRLFPGNPIKRICALTGLPMPPEC
jgi:tRNA 2-thiouridine synthesizing protein E